MNKEYSGWSNHETWRVMVYIHEDQELHEMVREWSENTFREFDGEPDYSDGIRTLAETLEERIENQVTDTYSLYQVNWQEIAENLIDQARKEVSA